MLVLIGVIGGVVLGWSAHSLYLRRLHELSRRIRRVQQGGKWRK